MFYLFDGKIEDCACCFDIINQENYVLYKATTEGSWISSSYCKTCIIHFLNTEWEKYTSTISTTDCLAELTRLILKGPPLNFREPALPCDNENGEVNAFYYDDGIQSSKLDGSLTGEDREKYIEHINKFLLSKK